MEPVAQNGHFSYTSYRMNIYKAGVSRVKEVCESTFEIEFDLSPDLIEFKAGQYVWVQIPKEIDDPKGNMRAFSIVSTPDEKNIRIVFRKGTSNYKKHLLTLRPDEKVLIFGPFGFLNIPAQSDIPVVFIVGGVGIAPFMSMVNHATQINSKQQVRLIYANSRKESAPYLEQLQDLKSRNSSFDYVNIFGKVSWQDIEKVSRKLRTPSFYVLGPETMVKSVAAHLFKHGVANHRLVFEEYSCSKESLKKTGALKIVNDQVFKLAVQSAFNHIVITDLDGTILYANSAASHMTGFSTLEMIGNTPRLWGGLMNHSFYKNLWTTIKAKHRTFLGELTNRHKDGTFYTARVRISPIIDSANDMIGFIGTEEDITKEKEVEKLKDEFVSIASHELRTPLTAIDGLISMVLDGEYGEVDKNLKQPLEDVNTSSARLIHLVNDLLNLSRIQAGRMKYTLSEFSIADVITETVQQLEPLFTKKGLRLTTERLKKVRVRGDSDKVKEVLNNLIGNSLKFTDKGGVTVSLKVTGDKVHIFVRDTGIGIAKKDQSKLFGNFQQLESGAGRPAGTGLGLHISKEMALKMGGDIWLEKSDSGKGSTFAFSIPKS